MLVYYTGHVLVVFGVAFLLLAFVAAWIEVFPPKRKTAGGADLEGFNVDSAARFVGELGKLKTWLALAVVGAVLILGGSVLVSGPVANFFGIAVR